MRTKKTLIFKSQKKHLDSTILIMVVLICFFGLLMIYNASSVSAMRDFNDKMYFLKEQGKWMVVGFIALFFGSVINFHHWYKFSVPLLLVTLVLLVAVFIPGIGVTAYGANRWINLRFSVFQPAELAKLSMVIYLSAWLSNKERSRFLAFFLLMGMVVGLVVIEPDLGTSLIIGLVSLILYFISEAPLFHFLFLVPFIAISGVVAAVTSPYRLQRLMTFINPSHDPLGSSYHVKQILLALGSGGLFGLGLGKSRQKYAYLPEATTDSIFAIIGEEIGFIGTFILISFFLLLLYRCFQVAKNAPDKFGYLLGMGLTYLLGVQAFVNLSAMTVLLPLTGIPLPFISYGGSGLVVALFGIGIILNISKNKLTKK